MAEDRAARWYKGGCHCGAVRFELRAPSPVSVLSCSCSICRMTGFLHVIAARADFRLLAGADALTEYRFNTGTARHLFCKICGIKSFYVPRSHPDGYSVNYTCLDSDDRPEAVMGSFDGANWEASIDRIL